MTLPGGRAVVGRLLARRQEADGQWLFQVALGIPAAAVAPIEGEDYTHVPTERASRPWVLEALRHDRPDQRAVVLPGCVLLGSSASLHSRSGGPGADLPAGRLGHSV